jgi:AbiTii
MEIDAGDSSPLGARVKMRRDDALLLAEELLSDIELARIEPTAVIRKASRLARLLDDADAMAWLSYETTGYPEKALDADASNAARRSQRMKDTDEGREPIARTLASWLSRSRRQRRISRPTPAAPPVATTRS